MLTRRGLLVSALTALPLRSSDWSQWRGADRDGKSSETGLLERWTAGGPPLLFKSQGLGEGYASFSFAGGRLFTQGQRDGKQFVVALDAATGKIEWSEPSGDSYSNRRGSGPRGTPTLDGDRLYALSAAGDLVCRERATGKKVWSLSLVGDLGGRVNHWGLSESPLIDGESVIVQPGGAGAGVVALNKNTGETVWKSQSDRAGYSSAVVSEGGGVRQYVLLSGAAAIGLRAADGELLWRYPKVSNRTANVATPILRDDYVFVSSDYGTGCALLKLVSSGGGVDAEEVYFSRDMRNHYASSVLVGDHLYGFSSRILTAMRFLTGEVLWRDRSVGKGQIIFAEGNLYVLGQDGVVGLVEATPAAYREKSRFEIGRGNYPTWTLPVIAEGRLYLRDMNTLYCYDIRRAG